MYSVKNANMWRFIQKHHIICFAILLSFAMMLRILYVTKNPMLDRDSIRYCEIAYKWHQTGDRSLAMESNVGETNPGYYFILKKGIDLGIPVVFWGRSVAFCSSILFLISIFCIGRMIIPAYGGEFLLIIAAIHPAFVCVSMTLLRDPISISFYAVCILALLKIYCNKSLLWCGILGICSAICFFLRYEALELPLLFLVIILLSKEKTKHWIIQSCCSCLFFYIIAFVGIIKLLDISFIQMFVKMYHKIIITIG